MSKLNDTVSKLNIFATDLRSFAAASDTNRTLLSDLRNQTQKFDSLGTGTLGVDQEYVDLDHWSKLVAGAQVSDTLKLDAANLRSALATFVVREHHGGGAFSANTPIINLDNASGVAVYFPPQASPQTYQDYAKNTLTFPGESGWAGFLSTLLDGGIMIRTRILRIP
jgi:hypothetical protein